jgi:hypothetical protein
MLGSLLCRVTNRFAPTIVFGPLDFVIESRQGLAPSFVFRPLGSLLSRVTERTRSKLGLSTAWFLFARVAPEYSLKPIE